MHLLIRNYDFYNQRRISVCFGVCVFVCVCEREREREREREMFIEQEHFKSKLLPSAVLQRLQSRCSTV